MQRKALRVAFRLEYDADVKHVFIENHLFTVVSLYIFMFLKYSRENINSYQRSANIRNHYTTKCNQIFL